MAWPSDRSKLGVESIDWVDFHKFVEASLL